MVELIVLTILCGVSWAMAIGLLMSNKRFCEANEQALEENRRMWAVIEETLNADVPDEIFVQLAHKTRIHFAMKIAQAAKDRE